VFCKHFSIRFGLKYLAGIECIQAVKHRRADSNCCEGSVDRCSILDMTACIMTGTAWDIDSFSADLWGGGKSDGQINRYAPTSGLVIAPWFPLLQQLLLESP
jgi:hypothetical protein